MAIWNTTTLSQLKPIKDFISEHYQLDRELVEKKLNTISSHKLGYYFIEDTLNILPSKLNQDYRVYDLTNTLSAFLEGGINPTTEKVASNKKIAKTNDFIISRLRHYLKEMAIVAESEFKTALSTEYLVFRKKRNVSNEMLLAFSLTDYVQTILLWAQTGNEHPRFPSNTFKDIYLPDILVNNSEYFKTTIQDAIKLRHQSQTLYKQATDLLEQELGIDKISFEKPKSYTATFSEALDFSRIDSEHYQPRYRKIREIITNYKNNYERLLTKITTVKPSYNLTNHPTDNIHYIELSNINPAMGYIDKVESINKSDAPSRAKRIVQYGDVIASSIVGSVDKAGLVSETENGFIASNGFFQFRSSFYSPEFLLLIIKSNIVKEQFQQQSTGGILSAVPDQNLKHILIPKISSEIQNKITELVRQSHKYIKQSQQLLTDAKAKVEQLIEKAANNA